MGYQGSGKLPIEKASKIGHIRLIDDPHLQQMWAEFESFDPPVEDLIGEYSGHISLDQSDSLHYVVVVDGGEDIVKNRVRPEKRVAYISVCALLIDMDDIEELRNNPIIDPRDLAKRFRDNAWHNQSMLPLSGVRVPGLSAQDTVRRTIDSTLHYTGLYETLRFLISREWDDSFVMGSGDAPNFFCLCCGEKIYLPKSTINYCCPHCNRPHTLADYLGIAEEGNEDWTRLDAVKAFRNVLETLTLFHYLRVWRHAPEILRKTLFIKDGPLMLRAGLHRLVTALRAFIAYLRHQEIPLYVVGIEKNGELVDHLTEIKPYLPDPGDFFLPSVSYLIERINGFVFDPKTYRNRAQYGSKFVARIGPHHILPLDIATGEFLLTPRPDDLFGLEAILATLSRLTSYRYENAIIPLILANAQASISDKPSGSILGAYSSKFLNLGSWGNQSSAKG